MAPFTGPLPPVNGALSYRGIRIYLQARAVFRRCWAAVTDGAASKPPAPFVVVSATADRAASHSPPHDRSLEARRCAAESSSVSGESAKLTLSPALL